MGFYYVGPIDGHDLTSSCSNFKNARDSKHEGPIMIHIKTQKGKGYSYAEKATDHYHGVSKFNVEDWRTSEKWQAIFQLIQKYLLIL